jgi:hypothetical protein
MSAPGGTDDCFDVPTKLHVVVVFVTMVNEKLVWDAAAEQPASLE